jgi:hypothetical protein
MLPDPDREPLLEPLRDPPRLPPDRPPDDRPPPDRALMPLPPLRARVPPLRFPPPLRLPLLLPPLERARVPPLLLDERLLPPPLRPFDDPLRFAAMTLAPSPCAATWTMAGQGTSLAVPAILPHTRVSFSSAATIAPFAVIARSPSANPCRRFGVIGHRTALSARRCRSAHDARERTTGLKHVTYARSQPGAAQRRTARSHARGDAHQETLVKPSRGRAGTAIAHVSPIGPSCGPSTKGESSCNSISRTCVAKLPPVGRSSSGSSAVDSAWPSSSSSS